MPFNRDLIESGCALKTFDGDLSLLEHAIDFTVKKSASSPNKSETVAAPASNNFSYVAANVPKEKRHIKDVVYGDTLDELPATFVHLACRRASEATLVQEAHAPVARKVVETPAAASGFCFRHIVEDTETISSTLQSVCNTPASPPVVSATRLANTQANVEAMRVSRSVKDVVYGETDFDAQCGQSSQMKKEEKQEPQISAKHFKTCMREELSADSAPYARIAVKALVSEVSHHTHFRSAIHGF